MKIGSTYRIRDIQGRHWRELCRALRIDEDETIGRIDALAEAAGDRVGDLGARMVEEGLDAEVVGRLVDRIGTAGHEPVGSCWRTPQREHDRGVGCLGRRDRAGGVDRGGIGESPRP